jgi:hypothetical protein
MENHKIILCVFDILFENIKPYIDEIFKSLYASDYLYVMEHGWKFYQEKQLNEMKDYDLKSEIGGPKKYLDLLFYINSIIKNWDSIKNLYSDNYLFILCHDIRYFRNKWAHQSMFTLREVYRVTDLAQSILEIMNLNYDQMEFIRIQALNSYYNQGINYANRYISTTNTINNFNNECISFKTNLEVPEIKKTSIINFNKFNHLNSCNNSQVNINDDHEMIEGDEIDRENINNENYQRIINNKCQEYTISHFGDDDN